MYIYICECMILDLILNLTTVYHTYITPYYIVPYHNILYYVLQYSSILIRNRLYLLKYVYIYVYVYVYISIYISKHMHISVSLRSYLVGKTNVE